MTKIVLGTRLLCKPIKEKEDSKIIIPDTVDKKDNYDTFRVEIIGQDVEQVQVGDIVKILPRDSNNLFYVDEYFVLDENRIVMVEREE